MEFLKELFCRIFSGLRIYDTSEVLDKWFNDMMDKNEKIEIIDMYTVKFAGKKIWVENKYYASPRLYEENSINTKLPKCRTSKRFFKLLDKATEDYFIEELYKKDS